VRWQKLATPTTTYEERPDRVKYRVERYEPAASLCQQVPDVWDRAQTREMMDHVVGDSEYVQKVNEVLPTGCVGSNYMDTAVKIISQYSVHVLFIQILTATHCL